MGFGGIKRNIMPSEIIAAQSISRSASECARNLGVNYNTYRKYATMYGLFDRCKNKFGKGVKKIMSPHKTVQKIDEILENKYPKANAISVLEKLIRAKYKNNECEVCGYKERRIVDNVIPLILCFKDANHSNFKLENLEVCCYNCAHNMHDAFFKRKTQAMSKRIYNIADE